MASKKTRITRHPLFWIIAFHGFIPITIVAFHALAVGGILAFEIFKSDPPPVSQAIAPVESPSDQVYVIQKGDTIYGVARRFGASPEQLLRYNAIADPESITIGTQVRIPKAGEAVERD